MNSWNPTAGDAQIALNETMRTYWIMFLIQGLLMIALGTLALAWAALVLR